MTKDVLAIVQASAPRRWMGVLMLYLLGGILIYVAFSQPPAPAFMVFLLVVGAAALWLAEKTRRATERVVELTAEGLRDNSGEVIAPFDQIVRVERGVFAMKPSNGFMVHLKDKRSRRWLPGLWWCLGRKVGIGGVTPGHQTKAMAQILEAMIVQRDGER
ncbi:hypothetical protein [Shimia biformata]|uniref:hypothetical protein n=1 Tax=Shimia biformata TaxID=1294299 RepID=UPI00194E5882|nr:hypothetical protein [Shimia biformata]